MTKSSKVPFSVSSAGAVAATRYVGGTTSGAPTTGTFVVGDFAVAQNGHLFICTVGGTPGTWVDAGAYGAGGGSAPTVSSVTTATTVVTNTIYLASGTFNMTVPVTAALQATIKNTGTGTITVLPASGTIENGANAVLSPLVSINVVSDGTNVWVV